MNWSPDVIRINSIKGGRLGNDAEKVWKVICKPGESWRQRLRVLHTYASVDGRWGRGLADDGRGARRAAAGGWVKEFSRHKDQCGWGGGQEVLRGLFPAERAVWWSGGRCELLEGHLRCVGGRVREGPAEGGSRK